MSFAALLFKKNVLLNPINQIQKHKRSQDFLAEESKSHAMMFGMNYEWRGFYETKDKAE